MINHSVINARLAKSLALGAAIGVSASGFSQTTWPSGGGDIANSRNASNEF